MKKVIDEEEGYAPERQKIYFRFFKLENHLVVGECLTDGCTISISLPTASQKPIPFESDKEQFIVHGTSTNFECQLLIPDRPEKIRLRSRKFGVVYHTEGETGNRVFHVRRYDMPKKRMIAGSMIQMREKGNDTKVVLVIDDGPNGEEIELDDVDSKTFRENERTGKMALKDYLSSGGSIASIFSDIAQGICAFIDL